MSVHNPNDLDCRMIPDQMYDVNDELIPMDEWNGSCWKTLFDWFSENVPEENPWDCLAAFIKLTLMKGDEHE